MEKKNFWKYFFPCFHEGGELFGKFGYNYGNWTISIQYRLCPKKIFRRFAPNKIDNDCNLKYYLSM